jgi:hypothetical protein
MAGGGGGGEWKFGVVESAGQDPSSRRLYLFQIDCNANKKQPNRKEQMSLMQDREALAGGVPGSSLPFWQLDKQSKQTTLTHGPPRLLGR